MNRHVIIRLCATLSVTALLCASVAWASPPAHGFSGFELQQTPTVQQQSPREEARVGLERIGVLIPLFKFCHTPLSLRSPYLKLEKLLSSTAIDRGVASIRETRQWISIGIAQAKRNWAASKARGANTDLACLAVENELAKQKPLVEDTLQKLHALAEDHLPIEGQ